MYHRKQNNPREKFRRSIRSVYETPTISRDILRTGFHIHITCKLHENSAGASFIQGLDLERTGSQGSSHSGISTKDGSIVQLSVNNAPLPSGGTVILHLIYDGLLSIRDGSVDVWE